MAKSRPKVEKKIAKTVKKVVDAKEDPEVIELLKRLDHPLKKEFEVLRRLILDASAEVREGVKWKAPSFRTSDYFATINLREMKTTQLILHRGAKVKALPKDAKPIADPKGLLKWLAADRCMVSLGAGKEFEANCVAFVKIIKEWLKTMMAN